ncbi:MAG: ribosome biogenesis GTPase YlqF [Candidatus Sericytochromatia bacterium]|nr:ribosome biogenesis GTPase YlqF [Candidatus Sericytochromatia bacterium]
MQLINWYPGHIAKAQRKLKDNIKLVDLVIEMVDARLPVSSHFGFVDELLNNKDKLIILNKTDLSIPQKVEEFTDYWKEKNVDAISISTIAPRDIIRLKITLKKYHEKLTIKLAKRGILPRSLRIMVIGIPNIGKSTLINRLVVKKKVKTGDKPGVTRSTQWVRIGDNVELLDTPGIIIPKFDDQEFAIKLVMIGSISLEAYEPLETAREIIHYINRSDIKVLEQFGEDFSIEKFAKMRNFLLQGAELDISRSAKTFIKELRDGKLGSFSLD